MKWRSFSSKYSPFAPIFTALGAFAAVLPLPTALGAVFGVLFLGGNGWLIGRTAFPKASPVVGGFLGAVAVAAMTTVVGTVLYYLIGLGPATAFLALASAPIALLVMAERHGAALKTPARMQRPGAGRFLAQTSLIALMAVAFLHGLDAAAVGATESLRSPWEVVPGSFFASLAVLCALAFTAAYAGFGAAGTAGLAMLAALIASVAASAYGIGFGFDPFIHRATEKVILEHGAISPKPFYYIGQYAIVTVIARIIRVGTDGIDLRLMAVTLAAIVPIAVWGLRHGFGWRLRTAVPAAFTLLLLPLASFASTTPQGVANALFIAVAFAGVAYAVGASPLWFPALLAIAATCVHPLAGMPTIAFVALLAAASLRKTRRRKAILVVLTAGASVMLPAMFLANAVVSGDAAGVTIDVAAMFDVNAISDALRADAAGTRRFLPLLDFTYAWQAIRVPMLVLAGAIGLRIMRKEHPVAAQATGLAALAFFVNYLLLTIVVDFPFLIDYERTSYADRMADLALFALLPAIAYLFGIALARVRRIGTPALGIATVALMTALVASSAYLAYPRHDAFETSRGWSTGDADIAVVRAIEADAGGEPYVVLANQSVSAGAIRELGFARYYDSVDAHAPGPVFFYPVPTGGPLYAVFLDANETFGDRETIERAMDIAGVDRAYYVVSHYWWDAQRIIADAKTRADGWQSIDDKAWVFRYER